MDFKLEEFAGEELKKYTVIREVEGDLDNPKGTIKEFSGEMLIYKQRLRGYAPNNQDGGRIQGGLTGKALKTLDLELGDIIIVENLKFKITDIVPRIYADFVEFNLELMRNGK